MPVRVDVYSMLMIEERLRNALRAILDLVPQEHREHPDIQAARAIAGTHLKIVRLVWPSGEDLGNYLYDCSDLALASRWDAGREAAADALAVALRRAGAKRRSGMI